jgi:hypothetical protein
MSADAVVAVSDGRVYDSTVGAAGLRKFGPTAQPAVSITALTTATAPVHGFSDGVHRSCVMFVIFRSRERERRVTVVPRSKSR